MRASVLHNLAGKLLKIAWGFPPATVQLVGDGIRVYTQRGAQRKGFKVLCVLRDVQGPVAALLLLVGGLPLR